MATSGTSLFALQIDDIIEEAYERIGVLQPTGNDLRSAKRSLNLLLQDLSNRGELLWSTETHLVTITAGVDQLSLPGDTLTISTVTLRRAGTDEAEIMLYPLTAEDFRAIPVKSNRGRPVSYVLNRERDAPSLTFWPVPDVDYELHLERRRRLQDVNQYTETLDVSPRFVPAIVSGLAWQLADKRPGQVDPGRRGELQMRWETEIERALSEDRERVSLILIPDFGL